MSTWNLDFGMVEHWDDSILEHETMQMKIEYDTNSVFPVEIERLSNEGSEIITSKEFAVKMIQSSYGNIEICGDIYSFTDEQIALIESVMPYWQCQTEHTMQKRYDNSAIYLGLVFHYNGGTHEFVMSDLEINREIPITVKIKEYDLTTKMVTNLTVATSEQWEISFISYQDDYQLYSICGQNFLLNDFQASYIDSI